MESTSKAREPFLKKLRIYDAHKCIIYTEGYRSGHNEAVLKTVCRQARGFESHSLRQRKAHRKVCFLRWRRESKKEDILRSKSGFAFEPKADESLLTRGEEKGLTEKRQPLKF